MAELGEITPDVLDIPNWDEIAKELGSLEGVPAKLMRSDAEIKKSRKDRQTKMARAEAAAQAQEEGAGMEALGKGQMALREVGSAEEGAAGEAA